MGVDCDESVAFLLDYPLGKSRGGRNLNANSVKNLKNLRQLIPMKKTILALTLVAGLISFAGNAKAQNLIQNGILDGSTSAYYGSGYINPLIWQTSWNPNRPSSVFITTVDRFNRGRANPLSSINGSNLFWTGGTGFISQSFATSIGTTYNLSFYLTGIDNNGTEGNAYASIDGSNIFSLNNQTPSTWTLESVSFTATQSLTSLTLGLDYSTAPGSGAIADISVTAATVPEPSTYALFGIGALALVVAYRRKTA
jgi:hypothetical protein